MCSRRAVYARVNAILVSLIFQLINGLDNQQGRISTQGSLKIQTSAVHNQQGRISANQALEIQATDAVDNSEGQLLANQSLKISASEINNQQGTIGSVQGQVSLGSRTGAFNNMAGYVQAADSLSLDAHGINNQHGSLQGRSLTVHNQGFSLNNTQGSMRSLGTDDNEQLTLETGDLINAAGLIHSEQNLYLSSHALDNTAGQLSANGALLSLNEMKYFK